MSEWTLHWPPDADGVHLPADSIPADRIRRIVSAGFLIGVSCHSVEELQRAERRARPISQFSGRFSLRYRRGRTFSQWAWRALRDAVQQVRIPVLALGGITEENAAAAIGAGAAGIAAYYYCLSA